MPTTTRGAFPYPDGSDNWKLVRSALQSLADRLAVIGALWRQSTSGARGAAGAAGTLHHSTDTERISLDTGTAWATIALQEQPAIFRQVTLTPENEAAGEGGQLLLEGTGTAPDWALDVLSRTARLFTGNQIAWTVAVPADVAANNTALSVAWKDGATARLAVVQVGAPDSGGPGFRALRILN